MPELGDEGCERDDSVRRTIVLPGDLAGRVAAEAGRRGISLGDLPAGYAGQGLRHSRWRRASLHAAAFVLSSLTPPILSPEGGA